ncbi:MAG: prepilin-type N-terminal cleavage/methylation domain-containing protein [Deltaproteobacteria bacterium]|nr:prepilin-type N-terminal cleavage/methylation domain-containing protein [Deltaproteobacteria bacterium]
MSSFLIILCLVFSLPVVAWASSFPQNLPQTTFFAGIGGVAALTAGIIAGAFALRSYLIKHTRLTYTGYSFYTVYYLSMLLFAVSIESFMVGLVNIDVSKNYIMAAFNIFLGIALAFVCGKNLHYLQGIYLREVCHNRVELPSREALRRNLAGIISAAIIGISILQLTNSNLAIDWFVGTLGLVLGFEGLLFLPLTSDKDAQGVDVDVSDSDDSLPSTGPVDADSKAPTSAKELASIKAFKEKQRKIVRKQLITSMKEIIKVCLAEIAKLEKQSNNSAPDAEKKDSDESYWRDIAKATLVLSKLKYDREKIEGLVKLVFTTPYSYAKSTALVALANVNPGKAKDLALVWERQGSAERGILDACVEAIFSGKVESWREKPQDIDPQLAPILQFCGINPATEIVGQDKADIFRAVELMNISDTVMSVLVKIKDSAVLPGLRYLIASDYYRDNVRGSSLAVELGRAELIPALKKTQEAIEAHFAKLVREHNYDLDHPDNWASGKLFDERKAQIALLKAIGLLGDKAYAVGKLKELYEFHIRLEKTGRNLFDSSYSRRPILSSAKALVEIGELDYIVPKLWDFHNDLDGRGQYTVGVSFVEPVGAIKSYEYSHMHEVALLLAKAKADEVYDLVQYLWVKAINFREDWPLLSLLSVIGELAFVDVTGWLNEKLEQWQRDTSRDRYLDERRIAETLIQLGDETGADYLASDLVEPLGKNDKVTYNIYLRLEAADILMRALELDKPDSDPKTNTAEYKTQGFTLIELLIAVGVVGIAFVGIVAVGGEFTILILGIAGCIILGYLVLRKHFGKSAQAEGVEQIGESVTIQSGRDKKVPSVKVILFDLDGVLFRLPPERYALPARLLSRYGVTITPGQLEAIAHPGEELIEEALKHDFPQQTMLAYFNKRLREYGLRRDLTTDEFFKMYFAPRTPNKKLYSYLHALKDKGLSFQNGQVPYMSLSRTSFIKGMAYSLKKYFLSITMKKTLQLRKKQA